MRTIYPKRYSRAQRKRLRAQPTFKFTSFTLADMSTLWNSVKDSPSWTILGGNLIPKDVDKRLDNN